MAVTDDPTLLLLTELSEDLKRLQAQKKASGVEARILQNIAFDEAEHWVSANPLGVTAKALNSEEEKNKLHLVFNLGASLRRKLVGRLAAFAGVFKAVPDKKDPKAYEEAEVVDRLDKALDKKCDEASLSPERYDWLTLAGTVFEYIPWVKNATIEPMPQFTPENELLFVDTVATQQQGGGQPVLVPQSQMDAQVAQGRPREHFEVYEEVVMTGDVGDDVVSPLNVFVDQSIKAIHLMAPDQWVHIARPKTQGWIAEQYGADAIAGLEPDRNISIVTTPYHQVDGGEVACHRIKDLLAVVQGSSGPDDPPMNVFVEAFQAPSQKFPHGRKVCYVPNKRVFVDPSYPNFENPYEEIPLVDFHWNPTSKTFWSKDYWTDLIAPQRFLNKRISQLGENSNANTYAPKLLGPGLSAKDLPTDYPGVVENGLNDQGQPQVAVLPAPQLPQGFLESINIVNKLLRDIAGGSDLMQEHRFPGQLRGPMAVPMLQEILDTEWGPFFTHYGERLARVKQMRLNRVKQFYPPVRTLHYTDRTQRDDVFEFHTEKILRAGTNYSITIERGSLLPELRALREARITERLRGPLAVLYMDERTGRLDKSKIAADLQFGDIGREGQDAQARKLALELIARLWTGDALPPVLPFWPHAVMMDELEAVMTTTEFLSASPPIQQAFFSRWQEHNQFLQQAAQQQQQAMQSNMVQNAVAQATQQAAAQAAADTVNEIMAQMKAQMMQVPSTEQALVQRMGTPMGGIQ